MENKNEPKASAEIYQVPGIGQIDTERAQENKKYAKQIFEDNPTIKPVQTPWILTSGSLPDLGQRACIGLLKEKLQIDQHNTPKVIHAFSQGTATTLNYLGQIKDNRHNIKLVVLEGTVASGNSAIRHTVGNGFLPAPLSWLAKVPGSYVFLPYVAKCSIIISPFYRPAGMQAITSISSIDKNIPIVLIHSKGDREVAHSDSCALYYALKTQGHEHVYFISEEGDRHIHILQNKRVLQKTLQQIYARHVNNQEQDPTPQCIIDCQPDHTQYKWDYYKLIARERIHQILQVPLAAGILYAGYRLGKPRAERFVQRLGRCFFRA